MLLMRILNGAVISILGMLLWATTIEESIAQIQLDATLGRERSIVTPQTIKEIPSTLIQGGALRGSNLFHSFEQFNINAGQGAYFANPTGVTNILTRVTGGNLSRIDGTLGVLGAANLFILNPQGIQFGSGAKLDLSGSFTASTAGSIGLGKYGSFNAVNPEQSNLLDVKPNVYFENAIGQQNLVQIQSIGDLTNSGNLSVGAGQTLSLYGSTVYQSGSLTAPSGRVEVLGDRVGLMSGSTIDVSSPQNAGTVLVGGDFKGLGTVPLAQVTYVAPSAKINANSYMNGNGGQVFIWGEQTLRAYGEINAKGSGSGTGGFVETSSRGHLNVMGAKVNTQAPTIAGTWLLDPHNVILNYDWQPVNPLLDGIFTASSDDTVIYIPHIEEALNAGNNVTIETGSTGTQAGNITANGFGISSSYSAPMTLTFRAANDIQFEGFRLEGQQAPLNLVLEADQNINLKSGEFITTGGQASLTAGNTITITGMGLTTSDGPIVLNAKQDISINGAGINAGRGSVTLISDETVTRQGQILLQSAGLIGSGGVNVTAPDKILMNQAGAYSFYDGSGTAPPIQFSAKEISVTKGEIKSETYGAGRGADLILNTEKFSLEEAGVITNSKGDGRAGDIQLNANQMTMSSFSLDSWTIGAGRGGDVLIQAKDIYFKKEGSMSTKSGAYWGDNQLEIVPWTTGNAGNLTLRAETIEMDQRTNLGSETRGLGNAGDILLEAKSITIKDESVITNFTESEGRAGNLTIHATNNLDLVNGVLKTSTIGSGKGGNLNLITDRFNIASGSGVEASTFSSGQGGETIIKARTFNNDGGFILGAANGHGNAGDTSIVAETLNFTKNAFVSNATYGSGNAGKISITGKALNFLSQSNVNSASDTNASGNANDITITADRLKLENGFIGNGSKGSGNAGLVNLTVKDLVVEGGVIASDTSGTGAGGIIQIQSDRLSLDQTAIIATRTFGQGDGGLMNIKVNDALKLSNNSTISASSDTQASGAAGVVQIRAPQIDLLSNSRIEGSTLGSGQGGFVEINAGRLNLFDRSQLQAYTNGSGNAGTINVNVTHLSLFESEIISNSLKVDSGNAGEIGLSIQNLLLDQSSRIATNTSGQGLGGEIEINAAQVKLDRNSLISSYGSNVGDAGSIWVNATNSIRLSNGAKMDVRTASGQGGNLTLNSGWLEMRSGSVLSAEAGGQGNGGNIAINVPIIVGLGNSDIIANAFEGAGGNIQIKTDVLLGLQFRDQLTSGNDITASSKYGVNGNVVINNSGIDASAGAVALPNDVLDPNQQVSDRCGQTQNKFVVTGRGGIIASPSQGVQNLRSWSDQRFSSTNSSVTTTQASILETTAKPDLVEIDRLQIDPISGQVSLVNTQPKSNSSQVNKSANCTSPLPQPS